MENQEYTPQICISANDPVNSVKSLEGSVIGILFEKKGKVIRSSIHKRFKLIDQKIEKYEFMTNKTEIFIEEKKEDLKQLDEYHQDQMDKKKAAILSIQKEIEEKVKKANDIIYRFDLNVFKITKEKAIGFEKGFDSIKSEFDLLDDLLVKESAIISGVEGQTGIQGGAGETGPQGFSDGSNEPVQGTDFDAAGNVGLGSRDPNSRLEISTDPGDEAYARLDTLRNLLARYTNKLRVLKAGINKLKKEKRRLQLTYDNIDEERDYKLDLNMVSAFGFEQK